MTETVGMGTRGLRAMLGARLSQCMVALALAVCAHGIFSTFVYGVRTDSARDKLLLGLAVLTLLGLLFRWRRVLRDGAQALVSLIGRLSPVHFWLLVLTLGIGARVMWWFFVPYRLGAGDDPPVNWHLATNLIDHGSYIAETTFGTWRGMYPPGLPFALVPFFVLFGRGAFGVLAANIVFFLLALVFLYGACRRLTDEAHARAAALLLAVLPNLVAYASQPYKEPLLIAEMALFSYAICRLHASPGRAAAWAWAGLAGCALGTAVLTQSSLAPAMAAVSIVVWLNGPRAISIGRPVALVLGAVLVIAPWSVRQSLVFERLVPLTTGGGWSFYTGNNPAGHGTFTAYEDFFPDLLSIAERDVSAVAFERGMAYVKQNPGRFVELSLRRQMIMTCCLDHAQAGSMNFAGYAGTAAFRFWKLVACASWLALAGLILLHGRALWRAAFLRPWLAATVVLMVVTFLVHSVMEVGSRHMTMHLGIWILLAVVGLHAHMVMRAGSATMATTPKPASAPRPGPLSRQPG